jgi:hypothetical protein
MANRKKPKERLRNPDGTWRGAGAPEEVGRNKRKPRDVDGILAALQEGTLDQRTKTAMQFNAVKEALGEDPEKVAAALLRHDIAIYATVNRAILDFVQENQGELVSKGGVIPEMLTRDFPKFQAAQTKALEALIKIERKQKSNGGVLDVADAVLDIASNQGGE